jgi:hypothetical protein
MRARRTGGTGAVIAAILALAVTACQTLPSAEPLIDGPSLAQALQTETGIRLESHVASQQPALANLPYSYTGVRQDETLLVLVFDSAAAAVQVTGGARRADGATQLLRRRNVVVFYKQDIEGPYQTTGIAAALRASDPQAGTE